MDELIEDIMRSVDVSCSDEEAHPDAAPLDEPTYHAVKAGIAYALKDAGVIK